MNRRRPGYKTFQDCYADLQRRDRRAAQVKALGSAIRTALAAPKPSAPCSLDAYWLPQNSAAATVLDAASVIAERDGRDAISREDIVTARVMLADAARAEIMKGRR